MARRTLTDAEREARAARMELLSTAAQLIENGDAARLDIAAAILAGYSRRNICLILVQAEERGRECPQAVAGFHDWRKAGRIVRKGAKGYAIYAPIMRKNDATGDDERRGYSVRHVFDVADTDPITTDAPATLAQLRA